MGKKTFLIILYVVAVVFIFALSGCSPSINDEDPNRRIKAVENIVDQATLAKVAIEDKDHDVRCAAVEKLTDQTLLAKLATEDKDANVRWAAIWKLTDLAVLARVVLVEKDSVALNAAEKRLSDPSLGSSKLTELANPVARANAISDLKDSDPILLRIAGDTVKATQDARECIARMKLVIQEPHIKSHFPRLHCIAYASDTSQSYMPSGLMHGECVTIKLNQGNRTLAEASWETNFPSSVVQGNTTNLGFEAVKVNGGELLKKLFHQKTITQEELAKLFQSKIAEIRFAAIANFVDPALLAEIAKNDLSSYFRMAAIENPNISQTVLSDIAKYDADRDIRVKAVEKLELARKLLDKGTPRRDVTKNGYNKQTVFQIAGNQQLILKKKIPIYYPSEALSARVEGIIILNVEVDSSGHVQNIYVISGHPLLNNSALDAIKQWRFEPINLRKKLFPIKFTMKISFNDQKLEAEVIEPLVMD